MKKFIVSLLLFLILVPSVTLFAEDNSDNNYMQLNMILSNSKTLSDAQYFQIGELASGLSSMQRMMIIESNKKSTTMPFVLNLFIGLGIGSYIQGDTKGGTIALVGELASVALLFAGYGQADDYDSEAGMGMIAIGAIGLAATRIYELIRPFSFASEYNKKLSNAMLSVSMVPVINTNEDVRVRVATNIKF